MQQLIFLSISPGSDLHRQAVDLRYRVFFQSLGLPAETVRDAVEGRSLHLAAVHEHRLVGCGRLTVVLDAAQVSQLAVEPLCRGRGAGSELLRRLVGRAGEDGVPLVWLNARVACAPFYARFGFVPVGDVFPSAKTGLPHQRMELILP